MQVTINILFKKKDAVKPLISAPPKYAVKLLNTQM